MKHWFYFGGYDSRDLGIFLETSPEVVRAKERVTTVTVPGRAGNLIIEEGHEGFENYTQSMKISVRGDRVRDALRALMGEGWLTLSTDPNRKQRARVVNSFNLKKASANLDWYQGTLVFTCNPFKFDRTEAIQPYVDGEWLNNSGDVVERPVITLRGSGTLSINGFTVTDVQDGVAIDCDALEVTSLDGTQLMTSHSSGEFPSFERGRTQLEIKGATACTIARKQRYL